jgi:hypothetical protein
MMPKTIQISDKETYPGDWEDPCGPKFLVGGGVIAVKREIGRAAGVVSNPGLCN